MEGTEARDQMSGADEQLVRAAVTHVRRLDPQSTYEAVEQYFGEIAEMATVLDRLTIAPGLSHAVYSPEWRTSDNA